ncbi:MAG: hypothetical protein ACP5R2_02635 [Anaerolineae bacterium]
MGLRRLPFWFMVFLVWVTFALRVIRLGDLPLELSLDESIDGLDALRLVREGWLTPFLQNNFGRETLFLYIQGITLHLLGISVFALRFCSMVMGTLTIPLLYAVGRQLAPKEMSQGDALLPARVGLLAATGMAVCYWHIYFSRLALRAIVLPPVLLACVWCLWRARRLVMLPFSASLPWWSAAGFLLGVTFYTYTAARLLLPLFILLAWMWLTQGSNKRGWIGRGLAVFLGMAAFVSGPLLLYFVRNPHAFSSRAAAISLPMDSAFPLAMGMNAIRLLMIQFGGGSWVGYWPSLNVLSGLGLFVGILACVRHFRSSTGWWLLSWWVVGFLPTLLSRQDWEAVTTPLRGIVAWPALCLIAAIGLAVITSFCIQHFSRCRRWYTQSRHLWSVMLPTLAILCIGGATGVHDYFFVWANSFAPSCHHARVLADYLTKRPGQLVLLPNRFYTDAPTRFLLQARYPALDSISYEAATALIAHDHFHAADRTRAVGIMPHDGSTPSAWTLLEPLVDGTGIAHLLPQLDQTQAIALAKAVRTNMPLLSLNDNCGEVIADVYPLDPNTPILPDRTETVQPIRVNFADDLLLVGALARPEQAEPGQSFSLRLQWKSMRSIDGDYDLFIHLFNLQTGQRIAQVNQSLGSSILLHSHFWSPGLTVQEIHAFQLPQDAPEGVYQFEVGLYHRASGQRLMVQTADGNAIRSDSITLGKLVVRKRPPPAPAFALNIRFEDNILLRGLDVYGKNADMVGVVLHWQAVDIIPHDYTVFTHLLDERGSLVAQQDNMPQQGRYPTSWWSPGEIVLVAYSLGPLSPVHNGRYRLRIGLYDLSTGRRLHIVGQEKDYVEVVLRWSNGHFSPSPGDSR